MTAKDIDEMAKRAIIPNKDAKLIELGLFYKLHCLYEAYDLKQMTVEQARVIKETSMSEYEQLSRIFETDDRKRVALSGLICEANKHGCEICKKIARVYDGRDIPNAK